MDYSFFDETLLGHFTTRLEALGVAWEIKTDPIAGVFVRLPDDIPDEKSDELDELYDELLAAHSQQAGELGWIEKRLAGVQVQRPDGGRRTVVLDARLANRLMAEFSPEELAELVQAVADSLGREKDGPLCQLGS